MREKQIIAFGRFENCIISKLRILSLFFSFSIELGIMQYIFMLNCTFFLLMD